MSDGASVCEGATPPRMRKSNSFQSSEVQVAVRVRPLNEQERALGCHEAVETSNEFVVVRHGEQEILYAFDSVIGPNESNMDVFAQVAEPVVTSCLQGINGAILAYGQTASGKTFCIQGGDDESGIIELSARRIFEQAQSNGGSYIVTVTYMELYREKIRDLLVGDDDNTDLRIRDDPQYGFFVDGLQEVQVTSAEDVDVVFREGQIRRHIAGTDMNEVSSRSHTIFSINLFGRPNPGSPQVRSKLVLVDLAGSENIRSTNAEGERLKEGGQINKSLLALGMVISNLANNAFVNFRDSKLTQILQPCLNGNCRSAIICCITPANIYVADTSATLKFATAARKIKTKYSVNEVLGSIRKSGTPLMADSISDELRMQNEIAKIERGFANEMAKVVSDLEQREQRYWRIEESITGLLHELDEGKRRIQDLEKTASEYHMGAQRTVELANAHTELTKEMDRLKELNADLQRIIANHESDNKGLRDILALRATKLEEYEMAVERIQEENGSLKRKLSSMEEELRVAQKESELQVMHLASLEKDTANLSKLQKEVDNKELLVQQMDKVCKELSVEIEALKASLKTQDIVRLEMEMQLKNLEKDLEEATKLHDEAIARVNVLENERDHERKQALKEKERAEETLRQLNTIQLQIETLEEKEDVKVKELEEMRKLRDAAGDETLRLREHLHETRDELAHVILDRDRLKQQQNELESALSEARSKLKDTIALEAEIASLNLRVDESQKDRDGLEARLSESNESLAQWKSKSEQLSESLEASASDALEWKRKAQEFGEFAVAKERAMLDWKTKAEELTEIVAKSKGDLSELNSTIDGLKRDLAEYKDSSQRWKERAEQLAEELVESSRLAAQSTSKVDELTIAWSEAKDAIVRQREEFGRSEMQNQSEIEMLREAQREFQERLLASEAEVRDLKAQLGETQSQKMRTEDELNNLKEQMHAKHLESNKMRVLLETKVEELLKAVASKDELLLVGANDLDLANSRLRQEEEKSQKYETEISLYKAQVSDIQEELKSLSSALDTSKLEASSLNQHVAELTSALELEQESSKLKMEQFEAAVEQTSVLQTNTDAERQEWEGKVDALSLQLASLQENMEQVKAEKDELKISLEQTRNAAIIESKNSLHVLDDARREHEMLKEELAILASEKSNIEERYAAAHATQKIAEEALQAHLVMKDELEMRCNDLSQSLQRIAEELNQSKEQARLLEQAVGEKDSFLLSKDREIDNLRSSFETITDSLSDRERALANAQGQLLNRSSALADAERRLLDASIELKEVQSRKTRLEDALNASSERMTAMDNELQIVQSRMQEMLEEREELRASVASNRDKTALEIQKALDLESEFAHTRSELEAVKEKLQQLQGENDELSKLHVEMIRNEQDQARRTNDELETLKGKLEAAKYELDRTLTERNTLEQEKLVLTEMIASTRLAAENSLREATIAKESLEVSLAQRDEIVRDLEDQIAAKTAEIERLMSQEERSRSRADTNLVAILEEKRIIEEDRAAIECEMELILEDKSRANEEVIRLGEELDTAKRKLDKAFDEKETIQHELERVKDELNDVKSKLERTTRALAKCEEDLTTTRAECNALNEEQDERFESLKRISDALDESHKRSRELGDANIRLSSQLEEKDNELMQRTFSLAEAEAQLESERLRVKELSDAVREAKRNATLADAEWKKLRSEAELQAQAIATLLQEKQRIVDELAVTEQDLARCRGEVRALSELNEEKDEEITKLREGVHIHSEAEEITRMAHNLRTRTLAPTRSTGLAVDKSSIERVATQLRTAKELDLVGDDDVPVSTTESALGTLDEQSVLSTSLRPARFSSRMMMSSRNSSERGSEHSPSGFSEDKWSPTSPERSDVWTSQTPEQIYEASKRLASPGTGFQVASSRVQLVEKERRITAAMCRDLAQVIKSSKIFALPSDDKIIPILEHGTTFRDLSLLLARLRRRLHAFEQVVLAQEEHIALLETNVL